jgi:hypothetical protein
MSRKTLCVVVVLALCAIAEAKKAPPPPVQITSSTGDSKVERVGGKGVPFAAIGSTGNLAVGAGNADGSHEVYELRELDNSLVQVTNSTGDSSSNRVITGGQMVVASQADLTPGGEYGGNADGSFEAWLFIPDSITHSGDLLSQGTGSTEDSFFQTFFDDEKQAFFNSKGDLAPGAPGNTDRTNEVFSCDLATRAMTQYTNSARNSLIRGVCRTEACAIVESQGDLAPGLPGNADGSFDLFLIDLATKAITQITNSTVDSRYRGQDAIGRYLGIESTGDLTPGAPGNADGSREVFVYDRVDKTLTQLTNSLLDSYFDGFVPRTRLVLIDTKANLVPGKNGDGSNELFTVDIVTKRTVQQTLTLGDSYFAGFAGDKNGLIAVVSTGDVSRRTTTVSPTFDAWMLVVGKKALRGKRLTRGTTDSDVQGFDATGKYVAIESSSDLVAGKNNDLSKEVFVARTTGAPKLKQVTSSVVESLFGGFTTDGKTLLVSSRGDLAPAGGNADGSFEVFRVSYK